MFTYIFLKVMPFPSSIPTHGLTGTVGRWICRQAGRKVGIYRQTYRQTRNTDTQKDRWINIHTDIQKYRSTDIHKETVRQTDIHTDRHTDIQTYRHTDSAEIQEGKQTNIQMSRNTNVLTNTYSEYRQTCRFTERKDTDRKRDWQADRKTGWQTDRTVYVFCEKRGQI